MILAAGLGSAHAAAHRCRCRSRWCRSTASLLINHVLDRLAAVGVETAVVNVHHFADQIEQHLKPRRAPKIVISDERAEVLGTGGGVVKALPLLGAAPFFHVNSDTLWIDGVKSNLVRLAAAFQPATMDALLLLAPTATSVGYGGRGDFVMAPDGSTAPPSRSARWCRSSMAGIGHPLARRCFATTPRSAFAATAQLFDPRNRAGAAVRAAARRRLDACRHARRGHRGRAGDHGERGVAALRPVILEAAVEAGPRRVAGHRPCSLHASCIEPGRSIARRLASLQPHCK